MSLSAPSTAPLPGKRGDAAKSDARRIGDAGEVIVYLQEQSRHVAGLLNPEENRTRHLCEIKQARHQKGVGWPESLRWCNCPCQRQQGHHGLIHNVTYLVRYQIGDTGQRHTGKQKTVYTVSLKKHQ